MGSNRKGKIIAGLCAASVMCSAAAGDPTWAVDPSTPGPDIPERGESLLDVLTLNESGVRDVPFPFERLIERIETAAGCGANERCTRAVLIPLGRSLQRVAASPDFFAHPRVVLAVTQQRGTGMPLRDRLFLGYQETQGLIEAISYNDAAGRFEFQLIKNYRDGTKLQVYQARRVVCISCHQNHAPIFSRQVWGETNANRQVAAGLAQIGPTYNGVAVTGASDISQAIDDSTERANRLSLVQSLWRSGCGGAAAGERCRADALRAALQFALASERGHGSVAAVEQVLERTARTSWPAGLAVPNPDLPNRDPFSYAYGARGTELANVPARFEPLAPRPPLDVVPAQGAALTRELVRGLAASWSPERVAALDAALSRRKANVRTLSAPCSFGSAGKLRTFECNGDAGATALQLAGSFDQSGLNVDAMRLGESLALNRLSAGRIRREPQRIAFTPEENGRAARLDTGDAIERVELAWSGVAGAATVTIRNDFSNAFGNDVEHITAMSLPALIEHAIAHVTDAQPASCCRARNVRPSAEPVPPAVTTGLGAALEPYCGACHRTADATPPNFLAGTAQQVERQLETCAPRIYVRLAMATLPVGDRVKTPMPPATTRDGRTSEALARLQAQVQQRLRKQGGRTPSLDELLAHGYERLPACLSATTMH